MEYQNFRTLEIHDTMTKSGVCLCEDLFRFDIRHFVRFGHDTGVATNCMPPIGVQGTLRQGGVAAGRRGGGGGGSRDPWAGGGGGGGWGGGGAGLCHVGGGDFEGGEGGGLGHIYCKNIVGMGEGGSKYMHYIFFLS